MGQCFFNKIILISVTYSWKQTETKIGCTMYIVHEKCYLAFDISEWWMYSIGLVKFVGFTFFTRKPLRQVPFVENCIHGNIFTVPPSFTVWSNQIGTYFAEMSSWTALTRHLGTKTTFKTKYMKIKCFRTFIIMIFIFHNII